LLTAGRPILPISAPMAQVRSDRGTFGLRAVVADESELLRHGVASALARLRVRVVGESSRGGETRALVRESAAELVVIGQVDGDLVDLVRRLKAEPGAPWVVLLLPATAGDDLARLSRAGADGMLTRLASAHELRRAVTDVVSGERYVAAAPLAALVGRFADASDEISLVDEPSHDLTRREVEVLRLVAGGRSNQEIADALYVSIPTVKTHLAHIYDKFGVDRRTQAVGRALELGLLS
jgi:DNA-binding NarL/FixJ family response regulator